MPRIPLPARYSPIARLVLALARRRRAQARAPEPLHLWGMRPRLLLRFLSFWRALDRSDSPLEPRLRSLVCSRVAELNVCAFCIDINRKLLAERGGPGTQGSLSEALAGLASALTERESAALAYAEAITATPPDVSIELNFRLTQAFTAEERVELTALIAFQNLSARFNTALGATP